MPPKLDGLRFETGCGVWRLEELMPPVKDIDRNRWEYWLQFKWVDPNNEANKATPEYRLRLDLFEEDMLANDAETNLHTQLRMWIEAPDAEVALTFMNPTLKVRAT